MKYKLLLAEDDIDLGTTLKQLLQINNFEVLWAKDGESALELFTKNIIDFCLLDIMMPKKDGYTLASDIIKIRPDISIIFLTALSDKKNIIKGLKVGVDDYITKPFEMEELLLKINNRIQKTKLLKSQTQELLIDNIINIGQYIFDSKNLKLTINNKSQRLTEKEALLINYLYKNRENIIKRTELLNSIWGTDDFFSGRSLDVFISRLRKYFKKDPNISINSIRGVGFEFIIN